ncbi:hypothetical protein K7432_015786, partial [Basidiobolus ranarum]
FGRLPIATPTAYRSVRLDKPARSRYTNYRCGEFNNFCDRDIQTEQPNFTEKYTESQSPLLKQVFTTITRKNDSLNTATANGDQARSIQYQSGPSLEAEGEFSETSSSKQGDTFSPYASDNAVYEPYSDDNAVYDEEEEEPQQINLDEFSQDNAVEDYVPQDSSSEYIPSVEDPELRFSSGTQSINIDRLQPIYKHIFYSCDI